MNKRGVILFFGVLIIFLIFFPRQRVQAQTQYSATVTLDATEFEDPDRSLEHYIIDHIKKDLNLKNDKDIVLVNKTVKTSEINVDYTADFKDLGSDIGSDTITINEDYNEEGLEDKIKEALKELNTDIEEVTDLQYEIQYAVYVVSYRYYDETDQFKDSIGNKLGIPCTEVDSKAELSPVTFYVQGCRVPYLLEDGGDYYFACRYYDSPLVYNTEAYISFMPEDDYAYHNFDWIGFVKSGTVIGNITRSPNGTIWDFSYKYAINNVDYYKLSDLMDSDVQSILTYDKDTKTLYYGAKPDKKEKVLQKDTIYEFVKKTIKGCKSDKEKVQAIHDAIIKTCKYDSKAVYIDRATREEYVAESEYLDAATKALKYKKGDAEAMILLFQESCNRLFIPCEIVEGDYGTMWNRVYISSTPYHVDVVSDAQNTTNTSKIAQKYCLKSPYYFKTYTFKIKSSKVQIDCEAFPIKYHFVELVTKEYKNGILKITFN